MVTIINERSSQILIKLIESNQLLKISDLSRIFKISSRTIRNDLDSIDDFLHENSLPKLMRKPNVGVKYSDSHEDKNKALKCLGALGNYHYVLSQSERINIILSELLRQKDYITIEYIAEKLYVSRSTAVKDLISVKTWLKDHGIKLLTVQKRGIKVSGDEKQLRRVAVELLTDAIDIDTALLFINPLAYEKDSIRSNNQIRTLFEDIDISYIKDCIQSMEMELETVFSDEAYSNLLIHIAIAIKRIQLGMDIIMSAEELKVLTITKEFNTALKFSKKLEEFFKLDIPVDEVGYITMHLLGSSLLTVTPEEKENWLDIQILTNKLIQGISKQINLDLSTDKQLFEGLKEHLRPATFRLKHGLVIKNPLLNQIKSSYKELFNLVKVGVKYIEDYVGYSFSDDEIGYLTMHFAAATERLITIRKIKPDVLIVCGTGIGTAKLLSTRLQAIFDVNIIDTIAFHQIDNILKKKHVDLIVSTVFIERNDIKSIKVNALLTNEDIDKLKDYMKVSSNSHKITNDLMEIIKKHCNISDYDGLVEDISRFINISGTESMEGVVQPMLKEVLKIDNIILDVVVKDWEEAVRAGGELLVQNGYVEHRYINAMIDAVKEIGPYIVIAPGIAMPHARPEYGVKQIGMSLIRLKNTINFGNKDNDPVKIVISLCAIDHSTHLKALTDLVEFLTDEGFISTVLNCCNSGEIIEYINTKKSISNDDMCG